MIHGRKCYIGGRLVKGDELEGKKNKKRKD